LELGEYRAEVEVSLNGEVVHKDDFSFIIESATASEENVAGTGKTEYAIIAVILAVVILLLIAVIKKKKK